MTRAAAFLHRFREDLTFRDEKSWLEQAKKMGLKVMKDMTNHDGDPNALHKAKDKSGNTVGEWDKIKKTGWIKE